MRSRLVQGLVLFSACLAAGCDSTRQLPRTAGELASSFSYVPLDPLPVFEGRGSYCFNEEDQPNDSPLAGVLESLPDQAVRLAVGQYDASGTVTFGPATIGTEGNSYQVILDYVSVDAVQQPIYVSRYIASGPDAGKEVYLYDNSIEVATRYAVRRGPELSHVLAAGTDQANLGDLVVLPVYVGVGLRLIASVHVTRGRVNLSSLGALAAQAEAGRLTGSLVVQTLGITGSNVSTTLPLPSELNQTTIQNAILALGSIKAVMHDPSNTIVKPRVVGIYNPIGGGQQLINGIIPVLAERAVGWYRPCVTQ